MSNNLEATLSSWIGVLLSDRSDVMLKHHHIYYFFTLNQGFLLICGGKVNTGLARKL